MSSKEIKKDVIPNKPENKNPEKKENKKLEEKKEDKKIEDKKLEEKKPEEKKEDKKPEDKKSEEKKEDKKLEEKKLEEKKEDKKLEEKKEDKKPEDKKLDGNKEDKRPEEKKEDKKPEDKKLEEKKENKKSEDKKLEGNKEDKKPEEKKENKKEEKKDDKKPEEKKEEKTGNNKETKEHKKIEPKREITDKIAIPSGCTSIRQRQVWVDKRGSNATGCPENPNNPFLTIQCAITNIQYQDPTIENQWILNIGVGDFRSDFNQESLPYELPPYINLLGTSIGKSRHLTILPALKTKGECVISSVTIESENMPAITTDHILPNEKVTLDGVTIIAKFTPDYTPITPQTIHPRLTFALANPATSMNVTSGGANIANSSLNTQYNANWPSATNNDISVINASDDVNSSNNDQILDVNPSGIPPDATPGDFNINASIYKSTGDANKTPQINSSSNQDVLNNNIGSESISSGGNIVRYVLTTAIAKIIDAALNIENSCATYNPNPDNGNKNALLKAKGNSKINEHNSCIILGSNVPTDTPIINGKANDNGKPKGSLLSLIIDNHKKNQNLPIFKGVFKKLLYVLMQAKGNIDLSGAISDRPHFVDIDTYFVKSNDRTIIATGNTRVIVLPDLPTSSEQNGQAVFIKNTTGHTLIVKSSTGDITLANDSGAIFNSAKGLWYLIVSGKPTTGANPIISVTTGMRR